MNPNRIFIHRKKRLYYLSKTEWGKKGFTAKNSFNCPQKVPGTTLHQLPKFELKLKNGQS